MIVASTVFLASCSPTDSEGTGSEDSFEKISTQSPDQESQSEDNKESEDTKEDDKESEDIPYEYESATDSAQTYVDTSSFSYSGLKNQLKFEGYPKDAIKYAMKHVDVDYKEEAIEAINDYKDSGMPFSKKEMRSQLKFEGFKKDTIDYAMKHY